MTILVALAFLLGAGALAVVAGVAVVYMRMGGQERSPPRPDPSRVVLPGPLPQPIAEQPPIAVTLLSEPPGAEVFENDQLVCRTPCDVSHPAHAPLPRVFVFRAQGYIDQTFEMTEAKGPIGVELRRRKGAAQAPGVPLPRPTIGRDR